MHTAKVIEHEGFQLVLLPRSVHINSAEVTVELDHGKFVLTPRGAPGLGTLDDFARHMRATFPQGTEFPEIEQSVEPQGRDLDLDR